MYLDKGALIFSLQGDTCSTMSLVTNDEVENSIFIVGLLEQFFLRFGYHLDRLISGEYHRHPILLVLAQKFELPNDEICVG